MAEYTATISWERGEQDFLGKRYSREHRWRFDGGVEVPASASPHIVPVPHANPACVDPEEAFVAAIASCHMLVFLALAAKEGFVIDSYIDDAVGIMAQNAAGKVAVTQVTLRPQIRCSGETQPTREQLEHLHHLAHESCYIANSVTTEITVEVR